MNAEQAKVWLSPARFEPFLAEAAGDEDRALALYKWHAMLAASCFMTVNNFEVLVRNAIDGQLGRFQVETPVRDTWLMDFNILQIDGVKQVLVAIDRFGSGTSVTRGRVVAGVSFGFWAGLFGNKYEEVWRHSLRLAFPHGSVTRKDLSERMKLIQRFRNRLAHHDCLLRQPVVDRYADMRLIAGWIDPDAELWLASASDIDHLLAVKP